MRYRPFLKWAGNKFQIVEKIKAILPPGKRLIEPFVGSGAVFLNTHYAENYLTDNNRDLISLYQVLQTEGQAFIEFCRLLFVPENNCAQAYYQLRTEFNSTRDQRLKAALFVYLNRHGYNGLCRYNSRGGFNTPFGRYKKPYFPEKEMLFFLDKAPKAVFAVGDFRETLKKARKGDVVYCDPPYVPLSATANFTSYSAQGFGKEEQKDLAILAYKLAATGITVLVSNHATDFTLKAYKTARIELLNVQRFISCSGANRGKAREVL
ncbi:MAG: Dam family site-specific DNA-(adenine-N6)-methyltransferase, partial [Heliobacteriaceae bacterium]|nr:Dam family site-specific DNA-(adenine-N6)-methyltransferase [Heliobacteriaceae bacterium]